jgi:hypothetical protein
MSSNRSTLETESAADFKTESSGTEENLVSTSYRLFLRIVIRMCRPVHTTNPPHNSGHQTGSTANTHFKAMGCLVSDPACSD